MNISQLQPASEIAKVYGVKSVVYGGPGTGKTPIIETAPYPVVLATEPGLLSLRHTKIPIWIGDTWQRIEEFINWACTSNEPRQYFQTICIDSGTQAAEISLAEAQLRNRDGRRSYMQMSQNIMWMFNMLYYVRGFHVYIICKEGSYDDGITKFRPHFPGQDLYIKTPHLYDEVFRVETVTVNNQTTRMFRTRDGFNCIARDRIGMLNEYEPTHLGRLIQKCVS